MKPFDPKAWKEITLGKEVIIPKGRLWLRASEEVTALVTQGQHSAIAGSGREIDVKTSDGTTFQVIGPKAARVFLYSPTAITLAPSGPKFFNPDMMPIISASVLETTRATREMQLMKRQIMTEMRADAARHRLARSEVTLPVTPPAPPAEASPPSATPSSETTA